MATDVPLEQVATDVGVPGRALASGSAVQMASRAGGLLLQLGCFALITRLLGPLRFGDFAAGFAIVGVCEAVMEFGLTATLVLRFSESREPRSVLRSGLLATAGPGAVGLAIVVPVALLAFSASAQSAVWVLLPSSLVGLGSTALVAFWQQRLAFVRLLRANLLGQAIALLGLVCVLGVGHSWNETLQLLAIGGFFLLGALVTAGSLLPGLPTRAEGAPPLRASAGEARGLLLMALPLGISSSLSLFHVRADQVILSALGYRRGLAEYAVAYQVLQGCVIAINAVSVVGFSLMAPSRDSRRVAYARQTVALLSILGLAGSLLMLVASPLAVAILAGPHFAGAVRICRLLAPVVVLSVANVTASNVLIVRKRAALLGAVSGCGLVANVLLNLVLIPHLGTAGAATATVCTEGLGSGLVVLLAQRELPGSQPVLLLAVAALGTTCSLLAAAWWSGFGPDFAAAAGAATLVVSGWLALRTWHSAARGLHAGRSG